MFSETIDVMRADRLVSLVLLLRRRGRMTAPELAEELGVSTRTVQRDIDALSTAGVPVYADRGRHGGFSLLPGFRTELTGLNHDEGLALLAASSNTGQIFGLSAALASAMRKVIDVLPEGHQGPLEEAGRRILREPEVDLLSRRRPMEDVDGRVLDQVRRAVLSGHQLRFMYTPPGQAPRARTVDPLGLVTARERTYLLATRSGEDRTYRLSRMADAKMLAEPAVRPTDVDLPTLWDGRAARFLAGDPLFVRVRVHASREDELLETVRAVCEKPVHDGAWCCIDVSYDDLEHAIWSIWRLGSDAEVITPQTLRTALHERAEKVAAQYRRSSASSSPQPRPEC